MQSDGKREWKDVLFAYFKVENGTTSHPYP